jgi:3-deoxy-D-arabino-heptulosonate 7-phosphate (DAHP) synthase
VSGVAALIKAQRPDLSFRDIKNIIKRSAHQELTLMGKCSSHGRLDAAKALAMAKKFSPTRRTIANTRRHVRKKKAKIYYRFRHE